MTKKKSNKQQIKIQREIRDLNNLHERTQKSSRNNSPNIKTRTSGTKVRWKGWRYHEAPPEVITYSIEELERDKD